MALVGSLLIAMCGCLIVMRSALVGRGQSAVVALSLLESEESFQTTTNIRSLHGEKSTSASERLKWCLLGGSVMLAAQLSLVRPSFIGACGVVVCGALAGEIFRRGKQERAAKQRIKSMEFYLPTVMERIVMGVGTGLDIIPALREASLQCHDPVSELFRRIVDLSEGSLPVEAAIEVASKRCQSVPVKHALIHLALAHRQGGEIVRPLRELSDATQLAYQEGVEEQIAKLPVKAVLPLVITFAGLIVCFLTIPLMQVSSLARTVAHDVR
jgi:Flp pilus assembly protein TadB